MPEDEGNYFIPEHSHGNIIFDKGLVISLIRLLLFISELKIYSQAPSRDSCKICSYQSNISFHFQAMVFHINWKKMLQIKKIFSQ